MLKIESDIKSVGDFTAAIEAFRDAIAEQVGKVGDQATEMIKSKGVKAEKTDLESPDVGFRIVVDPGDIKKADNLGVRETVAKSLFVMVKQQMTSEFGQ